MCVCVIGIRPIDCWISVSTSSLDCVSVNLHSKPLTPSLCSSLWYWYREYYTVELQPHGQTFLFNLCFPSLFIVKSLDLISQVLIYGIMKNEKTLAFQMHNHFVPKWQIWNLSQKGFYSTNRDFHVREYSDRFIKTNIPNLIKHMLSLFLFFKCISPLDYGGD